ncbi:hypothetical protein FQA39_LY03483 [Lamprigera yunnana]|nr:hypothetical protein FQA39_LY03483 [Lamprigera yunnana]
MPAIQKIQTAKAALRKSMQKKLSTLSREEKLNQTERVLKNLFSLPVFRKSERISVYLSTDDEISTVPILKEIFDNNKTCFVPRYNKNVMEMVKLESMKDWEALPVTKWNIKQPHLSEIRENALESGGLDLVIIPGVAFTVNGDRLGHGKGYYDSFLTSISKLQSLQPIKIALAFQEQVMKEIPIENHDVKMDLVLYSNANVATI